MKKCTKCGLDKPYEDFHLCKTRKDGRQFYCKICLNFLTKKDYKDNNRKKVFSERAFIKKRDLKNKVDKIKHEKGCSKCGENNPVCLDFHHINPKDKVATICKLVQTKASELLDIEMEKCIILCANCHRKLHYDTGVWQTGDAPGF